MLDDIIPPRQPKQPPSLKPMRTQRLQGYMPGDARLRLGQAALTAPFQAAESSSESNNPPPPAPKLHRPHFFWRMSKRGKLVVGISLVLICGLVLSVFFVFFKKEPYQAPAPAVQVKAEEPPKPTTVASPLSGIQVSPELAKRPVTALMIENSLDARPQSGLNDAGIVFEARAEGGITRFMALFQETMPAYVGPVRSLRPYYIDFAAPFQASIGHVGGSPEALSQVRSGGFRDIDQFFNAGSYWRSSSRAAPHNVYTSFERLDALNRSKGYTASQFTPWVRKDEKKLDTPTATKIDVNISSRLYNSHYDYDAASNSYLRSEGSRPHISSSSADDKAGRQISPKAVVILIVPYRTSGVYSVYGINDGGQMFVFQNGGVEQGSWSKAGRDNPFVFKDSAGNPLSLNAGQTWVTLAAQANMVTYSP